MKSGAFVLVLALAASSSCGKALTERGACSGATGAPMPRASVGPDVTLPVLCRENVRVPVASVSDSGGGVTVWSVSVAGDPGFVTTPQTLQTCAVTSPTVAFVEFWAPDTAVPGDAFDAVATVRAADGSFPSGTARVHAAVVAPTVKVDKTMLELGDVAFGSVAKGTITFTTQELSVSAAPSATQPPFSFSSNGRSPPSISDIVWLVTAMDAAPGDYTLLTEWVVGVKPGAFVAACDWRVKIPIHVRILAPGG